MLLMYKTNGFRIIGIITAIAVVTFFASCVHDLPKSGELIFAEGWHNIERSEDGKSWWVWTKNKGRLIVKSDKAMSLILTGEVGSIEMPNRVDVAVNGAKVVIWEITGTKHEQTPFEPLKVELKAGENIIELTSHNPPVKKIPTDDRELAIAVSNLKLVYSNGQVAYGIGEKTDK